MRTIKAYAIISFLFVIQQVNSSHYRTLDYDEVRKEGGFTSLTLKNVSEIISSGKSLTKEEMQGLTSDLGQLSNLKNLDLKGQGIDDDFIINLSQNKSLKRIINLNLSKNEKITSKSIVALLESDILGSVRDLPQISGRFGIPNSIIYVKARETGIVSPEKNIDYFEDHRFGFNISYVNPITGNETSPPIEDGVKFVEVILK